MSDKIYGSNLSERFIEVACPFCNSEEYVPYRSISDIVKCLNCETVYLRKRFGGDTHKDLFKRYIPDEELIDSEDDLNSDRHSRKDFLNDILELTEDRGILLDIGSGWGSLLKTAKDENFGVKGYELNDTKAGFSADNLGFDIADDFNSDEIGNDSIDVITATYSLSNIENVKSFVGRVYKKLKHGGLFCGIVHNIESFASEALEDEWECLNPYENTVYFSPQSIINFLESAGFVIEKLYTTTGNYGIDMLKHIVADAFDLQDEKDILEQIATINADGMGEEIRFYARKPMYDIFEIPTETEELQDELITEEEFVAVDDTTLVEPEEIFEAEQSEEDVLEQDTVDVSMEFDTISDEVLVVDDSEENVDDLEEEVMSEEEKTLEEEPALIENDFVDTAKKDKLIIEITDNVDYDSVIYTAIKNMDTPMSIEVNDKDNFLPDYANNWNGVEITHNLEKEIDMEQDEVAMQELQISENKNDKEVVQQDNNSPMNRSKLPSDLEGGFSNRNATGVLPEPLPSPLSLNLGCGNDVRKHFINIDLFSNNPEVVRMDIRKLDLPDECADLILASDVLEHFSHREVDIVLKEWARVLKPEGNIIIRCPSFRLQMKAYMNGIWDADIASYMIFGGQTNPGDYHCIAFDEKSIRKHLALAGLELTDFVEKDFPQDKGFINLNMTIRAKKRLQVELVEDSDDILKEKIDEISEDVNSLNNEFAGIDFGDDDNEMQNSDVIYEDENTEVIEEQIEDVEPIEEEYDIDADEETTTIEDEINSLQLNIIWEGSQFAYHSLALVNREHCHNILKAGVAELTTVPFGHEDFSPEGNDKYESIYKNDIRIKEPTSDEIASLPYAWIRHQWPPKEEEPKGAKWIIMQPWEYSYLWKEMAELFSRADEIWTPSNYSRNAIVNSGIDFDKVQIIPNGIDPNLFKPEGEIYNLGTEKKFKFLFVGGTIYRKGIDILLNAYTSVFNSGDNICLVIKDMGTESFYKGMNAKERILQLQEKPDSPKIIYLDESLSEEDMAGLYRACDVLVSPYRGEGFSLPTLEAMASGLPVVVTQGGATDDFCDSEVAWLIESSEIELGTELDGKELCGNATMLEPDIDSLTATLRTIYDNPSEVFATGLKASYRARTEWTWNKSTLKLLSRLDYLYDKELAIKAEPILTDSKDSSVLLAEAEIEFMEKNYDNALNIYNDIILKNELSDKLKKHLLLRCADIHVSANDFEQAHDFIEEAEILKPDSVDIKYLKAKVNMLENNWIEALEQITEILDNWADWKYDTTLGLALDELLCDTAEGLLNIKDVDSSLKLYSQALKYNTKSSRACLGSAKCFLWAEAKEQAKEMLEWAVKLDPNNKEAEELLSQY